MYVGFSINLDELLQQPTEDTPVDMAITVRAWLECHDRGRVTITERGSWQQFVRLRRRRIPRRKLSRFLPLK